MNIETKTFDRLHHTFCYKILPLVYDNSLSYYELLCRVQHTVNEIIEYLDELGPGLDNVIKEFNELKEYVDNYFDNLDVQEEIDNKIDDMIEDGTFVELLEEITLGYITPEMYGAEGDGTTDDSAHFTEAVAVSLSTGKPLHLHNNKYNLATIQNIEMCSLYGEGAEMYTGTHAFTYGDYLTLSGVNFFNDDRYLKNENASSLFTSGTERKRILIENCTYTCRQADDTHRGRIFFRCFAEEFTARNILMNGAFDGIIVNNSTQLNPIKYTFEDITAYNTELVIDIEGYQNSNNYEGFLKNVHISNITMINTENEQINTNAETGRDCVLIGNVDGFSIDNIYCERARERAVYCSICKNGTISNVTVKNTEGVKIAGAYFSPSDIKKSFNITVSNLNVIDGINRRAIVMYNSRNISVDHVSFYNAAGYGSHGIELTGVLDDITIRDTNIVNCVRGAVMMYETSGWSNELYNIVIDGLTAVNPVATLTNYYAIRATGSNDLFIHGGAIKNVIINEGEEFYVEGSFLIGAVELDYAEEMKVENIKAWGVGQPGQAQVKVNATCRKIYVNGEYLIVPGGYPNIASTNGNYTMVGAVQRDTASFRYECLSGWKEVPALPTHIIEKIGAVLENNVPLQLIEMRSGRVEIYATTGHLIVEWTNGTPAVIEQSGSVSIGGNVNYNAQENTLTTTAGTVSVIVIVTRMG